MKVFGSAQEAKEFLVSRIVSEAEVEGVPLGETERKELYFSESAWTLPDMQQINDEFERNYDQDEYEQKIAGLVVNARERDVQASPEGDKLWSEAIRILDREDHYVLVMIKQAGVSTRPLGDSIKLLATAFAVVGLIMCLIFVSKSLHIDLSRHEVDVYVWLIVASAVAFYILFRVVLGRTRTDHLLGKIVEKVLTPFVRTK